MTASQDLKKLLQMDKKDIKKIKELALKLEIISRDLLKIIDLYEIPSKTKEPKKRNLISELKSTEKIIADLKSMERNIAEDALKELKQKELSDIYAGLGGSSQDRKKPKEWIIGKILWELFDFKRGHEMLKK